MSPELDTVAGPFRVVNVDIHAGLNVDIIGDVHLLSSFLRHGAFAAVASAARLEHVVAPWLVAGERARVLRSHDHLHLPTLSAGDRSWGLSRRVREIDSHAIRWRHNAVGGARVGVAYPSTGSRGDSHEQ